ncbi:Uncharacterised protein [Mycobacteroides abscessus subsp. abscessus]|nr:Uncharacterised protein [Mycobacteroides abscessus subsp. abscessus]SKV10090.1 Uncharacterised protein [Mycobacteroides abscessus subsp. abscessus]
MRGTRWYRHPRRWHHRGGGCDGLRDALGTSVIVPIPLGLQVFGLGPFDHPAS